MARYSDKKIPYARQDQLWTEFCAVLADMQDVDEVRRFLKDLFNRPERLMFARRLQVADLLEQGWTYRDIGEKLQVSSTTISRVHRWLKFGRDGYIRALRRLRARRSRG